MQLILVRHGEAEPYDTPAEDALRRLSPTGAVQAKNTAAYIAAHYAAEIIVTSPYIRAQQTADEIYQIFPAAQYITYPHITPGDDATSAIEWLCNLSAQCIVVVCHMNIVAYIEAILLGMPARQFGLAECSVLSQSILLANLSVKVSGYVPVDISNHI